MTIDTQHNDNSYTKPQGLALFAELISELNTSTKTNEKLQALSEYFVSAGEKDQVWVIAIFSGRRPRRAVNSGLLRTWCAEITNLPAWLFEECYHTVGDLAETISLLLPESSTRNVTGKSLYWYLEQFIIIEKQDEQIRKQFILDCWVQMSRQEIFVFNKLITGSFRIGVSQKMMVNALAKVVDLSASVIAHRISGNWDPVTTTFENLLSQDPTTADDSKPYPFYLSYALEDHPSSLGDASEWQAEWKWDGIRGQMIKRNNSFFVWSRGEELMTEKFPEYIILKDLLPDGIVLDGEIMPFRLEKNATQDLLPGGSPLPFAILQTRIGRKNVARKQLDEAPVAFFAYDILEHNNEDIRNTSMIERRVLLEEIVKQVNNPVLQLSPVINFTDWEELEKLRASSREINSEGIMLKRKKQHLPGGQKAG